MNKNTIAIIIGIVLAISIGAWLLYPAKKVEGQLDGFAECLANAGLTMYGAEWCSHCQNEKRAFGSSFNFVPYVECPDKPKECLDKGVDAYPTWIFRDGKKLVGEQGLEKLSQESGCVLQ